MRTKEFTDKRTIFRIAVLLFIASTSIATAITIGDRVQCNTNNTNVRSGAGTGFATIAGSPVNSGSLGVVKNGPYTGSGFTWWLIRWDGFSQDGYTALPYYATIVPGKPSTSSPGATSPSGPELSTLSPFFLWNSVIGTNSYSIYIRDVTLNELIEFDGITGTSWTPPLNALTPGHTYRWNMQAFDSAGGGPISDLRYFRVIALPSTPGFLSAAFGNSDIGLGWADSSNETSYDVERKANNGNWSIKAQLPANVTSYSDSNVTGGNTYRYRVIARNGVGASNYSNEVTVPFTNPPFAETRTASFITASSAQINGRVDPNGTNTSAYFQYGTSTSYSGATQPVFVGNGNSPEDVWAAWSTGQLLPNTTYHYRIVAVNANGQSSQGEDFQFRTLSNLPNITHYQPAGWSDRMVLSTVQGTTTDSTSFTTPDNVFLDFSILNQGATQTANPFYVQVKIDDGVKTTIRVDPPFAAGAVLHFLDEPLGKLTAGPHLITIHLDTTDAIQESDESFNNNYYEKAVFVTGPITPNVTITSPAPDTTWPVGSTIPITWTLGGTSTDIAGFRVRILQNGASSPARTFYLSRSVNSFDWDVPSSFVTSSGAVRVDALNQSGDSIHNHSVPISTTAPSATAVYAVIQMPDGPTVYLNTRTRFTADGSSGPIVSYTWEFSDGNNPPGAAAVDHTFRSGSAGWVKLIVRNSAGDSHTASVPFPLKGIGPPNLTQSGEGADPVNTATGNFVVSDNLLRVEGRKLPFVFQAYYNSLLFQPAMQTNRATDSGSLGHGWSHTFETKLYSGVEENSRFALIVFGDGHQEKFILQSDGGWKPAPGNYSMLTEGYDGSFSLLTRRQLRHQFDAGGKLITISDRNGNALAIEWEGYGSDTPQKQRILAVTAPGGPAAGPGRRVVFIYDAPDSRFLQKLTDPIGRTVEFTRDASGDLVEIQNARRDKTHYTYDTATTGLHQMLTIIDPRGNRAVRNVYDANRRVTTQEDASGTLFNFTYDFPDDPAQPRVTRITRFADPAYPLHDIRNQVTEDIHNARLQLVERRVLIENPDQPGFLTPLVAKHGYDENTTDPKFDIDQNNNVFSYTFTKGNLTSQKNPDDGIVTLQYDDPLNPTLPTLKHHPGGNLREKWEYDAKGNPVAHTIPFDPTAPGENRRSVVSDEYGQIRFVTDAEGHTAESFFDEWGNRWKTKDAEGNERKYEFDAVGRVTAFIDERNFRTEYDLDNHGNLIRTRLPNPADPTTPLIVQQVFDQNDNRISIQDPLGHFSYFDYDEQDRLHKVRDHLGRETITTFDALGNPVDVEDARHHHVTRRFDLAGRVIEETDQTGRKRRFKRDSMGNAIEEIDDDGAKISREFDEMNRLKTLRIWKSMTAYDETKYSYDERGQLVDVENPKHEHTTFGYNLAGQKTRLTDPSGVDTRWNYDKEGHELSATLPGGKTRRQSYTPRYQLKDRTDENNKVEHFTYDRAGNLEKSVSADGQETRFENDALGRRTKIIPPTGPSIIFTYDSAGRMLFMDDATGRTAWTYTELNQVESIENPAGHRLAFSYDDVGNRRTVTYPGGRTATYSFDEANRFQSVTDWQNRTISQNYTTGGRPSRLLYPNGVETGLGYDGAHRLNDVRHEKEPGVTYLRFHYAFDDLGKITSTTEEPVPVLNISERQNTYTYGDANELLTIDGIPVTHDDRGNLLSGKLTLTSTIPDVLSWDHANRLTGGSIGGVGFRNTYNGLGHRVSTMKGGITIGFVIDGNGALPRIMAETDGAANLTAFYLYAGDSLAARILPNGTALYYHTDRSGSVALVTDGAGSITAHYHYDPFGVTIGSSGSFAPSNPFRYMGGWGVYDNGDGTLHARARTYHADLGRFLSRDPLFGNQDDGQSLNRYVYALNDPLALIDPSGLAAASGVEELMYSGFWDRVYRTAGTNFLAYSNFKTGGRVSFNNNPVINQIIRDSTGFRSNKEATELDILEEIASISIPDGDTLVSDSYTHYPDENVIGFFTNNITLGHIDLTIPDYVVNYQIKIENGKKLITAAAERHFSYDDIFQFKWDPKNFSSLLTDLLPRAIVGPGTPYHITGDFIDHLTISGQR